jgi:hypothetical protein
VIDANFAVALDASPKNSRGKHSGRKTRILPLAAILEGYALASPQENPGIP